jgi:hypothetical protein
MPTQTTGIPDSQLNRWTNPGARTRPRKARERIKNLLATERSPLSDKLDKFKVEVQGSHKNYTTTHGSSDVDVLVRRKGAWFRDLSPLLKDQRRLYEQHHSPADYGWDDLREDVLTALDVRGYEYEAGTKSIKLKRDSNPLPFDADVVVCSDFKRFHRYEGRDENEQEFTKGIAFRTNDFANRTIINFPGQHHENGVDKNGAADEKYKPTARLFKNARDRAVKDGFVGEDTAPSYFIECLLYNVPNRLFTRNLRDRYIDIVEWLTKNRH